LPADQTSGVVGFGAFELDVRNGELRKRGLRLKLQDKPLAVLIMLTEHPRELVTRKELQQKLWPADTFVDFERGLSSAVFKLRQVLGDTADNPRFIETVPRRGYRFLAPLRKATDTQERLRKNMLVVLPFANIGGDAQQEYFADGMTEEMIAHLGQLNPARLGVIARTSAVSYKGTSKSIKEIAQELAAEFVLEGSVRRGGGKVRISAQLIQVSDQAHLWAGTYDRPMKDVLAIQAEVAKEVAAALKLELVSDQHSRLQTQSPLTSPEAYDLYLQGRYCWEQRTEESVITALGYFERATVNDPAFALAYTGVADCYGVLGFYGAIDPKKAFPAAKAAAAKALELQDDLAQAHCSLAFVLLQHEWNWADAEKQHMRGLELSPNYAFAHHWLGVGLTQIGRFREALVALKRALELDPLSLATRAHIGRVYYFARQYHDAVRELCHVTESDPLYAPARYMLGLTYLQTGQYDEAVAELEAGNKLVKDNPIGLSALAFAMTSNGDRAGARRILASLKTLGVKRYISPFFLAFASVACSAADETISFLQQAYEERFPWLLYLRSEPAFDRIRSDSRFVDLVRRIGPVGSSAAAAR
jgi:TolB-like protein/Flp pilus assembly protein TadD